MDFYFGRYNSLRSTYRFHTRSLKAIQIRTFKDFGFSWLSQLQINVWFNKMSIYYLGKSFPFKSIFLEHFSGLLFPITTVTCLVENAWVSFSYWRKLSPWKWLLSQPFKRALDMLRNAMEHVQLDAERDYPPSRAVQSSPEIMNGARTAQGK